MRRSKYSNKKVRLDGYVFDSKAEAKRYGELLLLAAAKHIHELRVHPRYPLHVQGKIIGHYVPDFDYWSGNEPIPTVEDVKGMKTPLYRWKKKHFEAQYGWKLVEIER